MDLSRPALLLAAVSLFSAAGYASTATRRDGAPYDLLITNARIVDGTGNPWYRGSVATIGDRIAYVGPSIPGLRARRTPSSAAV